MITGVGRRTGQVFWSTLLLYGLGTAWFIGLVAVAAVVGVERAYVTYFVLTFLVRLWRAVRAAGPRFRFRERA